MSGSGQQARRRRPGGRIGFSMIELILVLFVAGILAAVAIPQFGRYMSRRAVVNARDAFGMLAARARTASVERGDVVILRIQPVENRILVIGGNGADTLEVLTMHTGFGANVLVESTTTVCYSPRGYAQPGCGSADQLPRRVGFAAGPETLWSRINALGQVERQ